MAGQRQPTELVLHKGKKHLTKKEIEERRATEVQAPRDGIRSPDYLEAKLRRRFDELAAALVEVGIMSNLDCDALARYIQSEARYLRYDAMVSKAQRQATTLEKAVALVGVMKEFEGLRDKAFKQCRAAAGDLGLTISGRCRLVVPQAPPAAEPDPMAEVLGRRA